MQLVSWEDKKNTSPLVIIMKDKALSEFLSTILRHLPFVILYKTPSVLTQKHPQ